MAETNNFLFTQVTDQRPDRFQPHKQKAKHRFSTLQKLKEIKQKSKKIQQDYMIEIKNHHKVQKSLQTINRQSLIKRIQFLKIYGNKKAKYQGKAILQNHRQDQEALQRQSLDTVKRRKLQYELQHILQQNQEEEHIFRLQQTSRKDKTTTQRQLELAYQRDQQSKRHDQIKRRSHDFMIRKKTIQTSLTMRSRHNYTAKVRQELAIIDQYQSVISNIEQLATLQDVYTINSDRFQNSVSFRTLDPNSKSYNTTLQTSIQF